MRSELRHFLLFVLIFSVTACEKELDLHIPITASQLVVEGWIENDKTAEVILSLSAPYFSSIDSANLLEFAVTHAKVTLFHDSEQEILTLTPNKAYFPPFVYKSVDIKGETGETYSIEVVLSGDTVTASTFIPKPVALDSVWFAPDPGQIDAGRIWIKLKDNAEETNYYRILFMRKNKDSRYVPGNLSTFSDLLFNGKTVEMGFLHGNGSLLNTSPDNYFVAGDTVGIKVCSIDKVQFDFWNGYQNEVLTAANPLATSNSELKSNIKGGLGIWSGYGATYYVVYAKK